MCGLHAGFHLDRPPAAEDEVDSVRFDSASDAAGSLDDVVPPQYERDGPGADAAAGGGPSVIVTNDNQVTSVFQ